MLHIGAFTGFHSARQKSQHLGAGLHVAMDKGQLTVERIGMRSHVQATRQRAIAHCNQGARALVSATFPLQAGHPSVDFA